LKFSNIGHYLLVQPRGENPEQYLLEMKRLEWIFISARWLWVPVVFLMAWLHEPISETAMCWMGMGLGFFNVITCLSNVKIKDVASQRALGVISLILDVLFALGFIFLFAHEFYTAVYAIFVYIIIEASVRYGLTGSLSSALLFAIGLYGAYTYRDIVFGVRFSNSGYAFWTVLMFIVAISVGAIVSEGKRQRRQSEYYLKENTLHSERQRIARDMHDTVLKTLQGLSFEARALGKRTATTTPSVEDSANYIEGVCSRTSREIREVIFDLHNDSPAKGIGLQISEILGEWSKSVGIPSEFALSGWDISLPTEPARQIRNIMLEALNNIQYHASASRVQVIIKVSHESLDVEISDNGRGLGRSTDELHTFVAEGKLGIAGMKERVELLGGRFTLSSDRTGTQVSFSVPVSQYLKEEKQINDESDNDSHN
jgi:signal transduction histidine kinase